MYASKLFCSMFLVGSMGRSFCCKWRAKPWCLWVTHWGAINGSHWFAWYTLQFLRHRHNWSEGNHSQPSDSWWVRTLCFFRAIIMFVYPLDIFSLFLFSINWDFRFRPWCCQLITPIISWTKFSNFWFREKESKHSGFPASEQFVQCPSLLVFIQNQRGVGSDIFNKTKYLL